jgi:nucleoside-diphosphate kinase
MVVEGQDAIEQVRKLVGDTDPDKADPGTIRFDFAQNITRNIVHASDKKESAEHEIKIYFSDSEILDYQLDVHRWMFRK